MDDIISEIEIDKIQNNILPLIPYSIRDEFSYLLGLYDDVKDEFLNKIYQKNIKVVDALNTYNEDRYNAIDGVALKACDRLAAFVEATLSISHGVKSKELQNGKKQTLDKIKENEVINGANFYELALLFEESLKDPPQGSCGT